MLKSLFSGVSGLQSHQIAMDVESNNIANVNTIGYKYSRANFSDLLAQTNQIATAPQGELGGKNSVQVGLGTSISSVTRIHSQGSIQNTDKNTDVAIQGEGYFIVSADGGSTYKYSRSGDFKFDAVGNFVDNNGFIVQGWLRDEATGEVDSTAPITNILIPPGLTTPANASEEVVLKANLNSGNHVENYSAAYAMIDNSIPGGDPSMIVDADGNEVLNPPAFDNMSVMFNDSGDALNLQQGQGVWASFMPASDTRTITSPNSETEFDMVFTLDDGSTVNAYVPAQGGRTPEAAASAYAASINAISQQTGVTAAVSGVDITITNDNSSDTASHNISYTEAHQPDFPATFDQYTAFKFQYDSTSGSIGVNPEDPSTFQTMADLRYALQTKAQSLGAPGSGLKVIVDQAGKISISNNPGDYDMSIKITKYVGVGITENVLFTQNMKSLNANLPMGTNGITTSQAFNAAIHASSIDIYDSLGSKHTLRMEFRKTDMDATTGTTWALDLSVPEPGTIDTVAPFNEKTGYVRFNNDGSLATYSPPSVSFTGNNGSSPNQQVSIDFGSSNAFDGVTSFDSPSSTSGISQDGFPGGDLLGIRIDQSGTLVGSFSNGRSFGLAQIGMAKFANNEGLVADGSNVYLQSANSGDPIIGTAATAGRGFMQSSALEASNVDLSKSLTNLIIIQRGYQANGKTITTSDTLLETLIGLKR